jgi:hypothetical protein
MKKNSFFWATTTVVTMSLVYAYMNFFYYANQKYIAMVEYEYWIEELESEVNGLKLNHSFILKNFNHTIREKIYKKNSKIAIGIPYITKLNLDYMYLKGDSVTDMLSFIEKNSKNTINEVIMQADIKDVFKNIDSSYKNYCKLCALQEADTKTVECQEIQGDKYLLKEKSFKVLKNKYCNSDDNIILKNESLEKELLNIKNDYLLTVEKSRISIIHDAVESFKSNTHTRFKRIYMDAF